LLRMSSCRSPWTCLRQEAFTLVAQWSNCTSLKAAVSADTALITKETWGSCWNLSNSSGSGIWSQGMSRGPVTGEEDCPAQLNISSLYSSISSHRLFVGA
jgi:hypothetical protein